MISRILLNYTVLFTQVRRFLIHSKTETVNQGKPSHSHIFLPTSHKKISRNESESRDLNLDISPVPIISVDFCSIDNNNNNYNNINKNNREYFMHKSSKSGFNYDKLVEIEEKKSRIDVRQMEFTLKNNLELKIDEIISCKSIEINPFRF